MYYIAIDVSKKALSVFDGKKYLKNKYKNLDDLAIIFEAILYLFPVLG